MIKYFYEVNYIIFYYYDETDKENVEDVYFTGYFSSLKKARECIRRMMLYSGDHNIFENYKITRHKVACVTPPRELYWPTHEYSIRLDSGEYVDYTYSFAPKATLEEAQLSCERLKRYKKFKKREGRDYSDCPPDGFDIGMWTVDKIMPHGGLSEAGEAAVKEDARAAWTVE